MNRVRSFQEQGPNVPMEVTRSNGKIEFDKSTDGYAILCERTRASLAGLGHMEKGLQTRIAAGMLITAPIPSSNGQIDMTPTVLVPLHAEIGGAVFFGGLMAMRQQNPQVFAVLMRRLRDSGLTASEI